MVRVAGLGVAMRMARTVGACAQTEICLEPSGEEAGTTNRALRHPVTDPLGLRLGDPLSGSRFPAVQGAH